MRLIQLEKQRPENAGTAFERWRASKPDPSKRAAAFERWNRDGLKIVLETLPDSIDPSRRKVIAGAIFGLSFQLERGVVGNPIPSGSPEKVITAIERIDKLSTALEADGLLDGSTLPQERARLKQYLFENLEEDHGTSITATRNCTILLILSTLKMDHIPAQSRRIAVEVFRALGKPLSSITASMLKKIWDDRFKDNFQVFLQERRSDLATKIS